ncbi:39S ribosomal protein L40, mitochondrial [Octopus bimaculoides]|nr:39S ribosomal protein L40, mitochondrial [Octopus bimaculoides]|eukprot:XP_014768408.1 PREDICTED: 39S ribosomal protein L40, mitochondrial-like [Octopus bimaculoides]
MTSIISGFTKSLINPRLISPCTRLFHTQGTPLYFQTTDILYGMPMKKKKRTDVQLVMAREQRKRKKIEKQIKKLEKYSQKLKPIEEVQISSQLRKEINLRYRAKPKLSFEESENRMLLKKAWSVYQKNKFHEDLVAMDNAATAQKEALAELRKESEELYHLAIQIDEQLIPYTHQGPMRTIPIDNYESPDGDYKDTSRKWD